MKKRLIRFNEIMGEILGANAPMVKVELIKMGFFTAPASTKFHGDYEGGLFEHSVEVSNYLVELTEKLDLKWELKRSPYVVGMFHDLCKCEEYILDIETNSYKYNPDIIIPGHGDKSVVLATKWFALTEEEMACIRWHMGAFEKDPKMWEYYGRAVEKYPNVLFTHMADMYTSRVRGV